MPGIRWLPLESNPEVMSKYAHKLGVPPSWTFHDVLGLDPELLMMVPRPVSAILLLFPITEKSESQMLGAEDEKTSLYFIKQSIHNACGTIGLIHAICNNAQEIGLDPSKHLRQFLEATKDKEPQEKAKILEGDEAFGAAHENSALEGQTEAPSREVQPNLHFVAFIHHNGSLYELDGRRNAPILHGKTTPDTLLEDTAEVVRQFASRDPTELNFNMVALAKA